MAFIIFRNKKIFYRTEGSGNPVMLLHGFGEDGRIWNGQVEALKKDFRIIIPDLPGIGQSELLEGDCTMEDFAEVIKMITDNEEITSKPNGTFSLIGHSMGGYITLAFARKYGRLLNSFGLFHSSSFADNPEKISTRKKGIDFIKKNGARLYAETTVPNLFSDQTKKNHPKLVNTLTEIASELSSEALIQYSMTMINRRDTTDVLTSFAKPILFIIGIHDNAIPLETSLKQCHLPQIGSIHFLQKSGHVGMWEEQTLSNHYLNRFLKYFVYSN
jgi:pimeloyl-ACP methyl ester carboxylesterase